MKKILLFIFAGINISMAQSVVLTPFEAPLKDKNTEHLKEFKLLQLDVKELQSILDHASGNIYEVNLRTPDETFQLELYEFSMMSNNVVRNTGGLDHLKRIPERKDLRTFKGIVNGKNNSIVTMTIANGFLKLMMDDRTDKYFLEQYGTMEDRNNSNRSSQQKFVLYKEKDLIPVEGLSCGVTELRKGIEDVEKQIGKSIKLRDYNPCRICIEVQIALGADASMYVKYGSVANVEAFLISNMADVQTVYDDEWLEYEFAFQITGEWISDDPFTDPFMQARDINTEFTLFKQQNTRLFPGSEYDVTSLWNAKFTSPGGTIGLADIPGVCASSKCNVVTSFYPNVLTSPFYLTLQAHELGHNFTAGHDGGLSPTIMNALPLQATTWSPPSYRAIFSYVYFQGLAGGCLTFCPNTGEPVADFSADITYGCQPVTVKFTDLSSYASKWKWKFPGGMPDSSDLQHPVVTYKKAGLYPVTLEVSNKWCKAILVKSDYIEINDIPEANFIYGVNPDRTVFFTNTTLRGIDYLWKFGDGEESDEVNPNHLYARDSTYEVTITATNDCGTTTIKKKLKVISLPIANFEADTIGGCAPKSIKFTDKSTNNVIKWIWNFPGGTPDFSYAQNPIIRYDHPGIYDVTLTVLSANNSHKLTKPMYITIHSLPEAKFDYSQNGNTINFSNSSRFSKSHFWNFGDNTTSSEENPSHTFLEGYFEVLYIVTNACGTDTAKTMVTVGTQPVAGFQVNEKLGCAPFQVQFTNASTAAATAFKWYFPGGNPSTSTDKNPVVLYNSVGKFDVGLLAYNNFYSDSIGQSNFIEVKQAPTGDFTNTVSGYKSFFTNQTAGATFYFWDFGDGRSSFEENPVHDYGVEGEFDVHFIVQNECGLDTFSKHIAIYLVPKVNFAADTIRGCAPLKIKFFDKSSIDVTEWDWFFENGNPSVSNQKNPEVLFSKKGKYSVKLTVKNTNGSNQLTRTQYIQVLSPVLCPEQTKSKRFMFSEDPFGVNIQNRSEYLDESIPEVYPNPATDYIYIITGSNDNQNVSIEIYDLSGKKLSQQNTKDSVVRIPTDHLHGGTYYVKIMDHLNSSISKFVIAE